MRERSRSGLEPGLFMRTFVNHIALVMLLLGTAVALIQQVVNGAASPSRPTLSSPEQASETRDGSSDEVSFTIKLKDGKARFHPGEIITVEMQFSSSAPAIYELNRASYDRSGRLEIDQYHIEPTTEISDPLSDYYGNSPWGGLMGGGLYSTSTLTKTPVVIAADLNEWVRIDQPGRYSLFVTSNRVARKPGDRTVGNVPLAAPLTSNPLEFEVLPSDPVWSKQALHQAVGTLDSLSATADQQRGAARMLRFLDTPSAAIEMVHRLPPGDNFLYWEFRLGLLSTPLRSEVMEEMKRRLSAPDVPISSDFVDILATLDFYRSHSPIKNGTPEEIAETDKARTADYASTTERYTETLGEALASKTGQAQSATLAALLMLAKQFKEPGGGWSGRYTPTAAQQSYINLIIKHAAKSIPGRFLSLPQKDQESLLGMYWTDLAGPEMAPVLKQIVDCPKPSNQSGFPDLALSRLYQLDPEQGREVILKEISKPSGKFSIKSLGLLPEHQLPVQDDAMASRLESANGADLDPTAQLIQRYGSSAILPRVRTACEDKHVAQTAAATTALLAYFLRVDPGTGAEFIRQVLAAGYDRNADFMLNIANTYMCPELEGIALEALADPDPATVGDAIALLGRHASPAAQAPLMQAFEQWHEQWKDHEQELFKMTGWTSPASSKDPISAQPYFENAFIFALASGAGWLTDDKMIDKLESLCLTENGKNNLETVRSRMKDRSVTLLYFPTGIDELSASVGQYDSLSLSALKTKLSEFPKGTVFTCDPGMESDASRPVLADLKVYLQSLGMDLVARSQ
jgi:hypothetical protein